ncbi:hypothetical protein BD560DRAFT_419217 [Blakeslea trispora]|nr:hypothetical protein BD560DRAFT_419217 [Blakeslea trispora]
MPPPPLTRQNAFYCERSQDKTPLDPVMNSFKPFLISKTEIVLMTFSIVAFVTGSFMHFANSFGLVDVSQKILYHCKQTAAFYGVIVLILFQSRYAHQECFVNWFILHGCPRQCPACKSNYHIPYSFYLAVSVLKKNRYQLIFIALLILSIFIFTHVARCTNFQILTRQEFINQFGEEQYRNVPERISISCLATSFDNLTLSALYCTFITVVSIAFSCFIVLLKFYIK